MPYILYRLDLHLNAIHAGRNGSYHDIGQAESRSTDQGDTAL
jgi:hypothetical protein